MWHQGRAASGSSRVRELSMDKKGLNDQDSDRDRGLGFRVRFRITFNLFEEVLWGLGLG